MDGDGELPVPRRVHGPMPDRGARGIRAEKIVAVPIVDRPDRAWGKTAAAIRADIVQDGFDARTAEGTFKRANHRIRGTGRERRVAILAGGSEFEHGGWSYLVRRDSNRLPGARTRAAAPGIAPTI